MGTTVGRLYFYIVILVSVLVTAYGAGSLLATLGKLAFDPSFVARDELGFWRTTVSTYIPMLLVGGGVWAVHWFAMRRHVTAAPQEQQVTLRKLYQNVILSIASVIALFNAARFLYHLLSALTGDSLEPFGSSRPQDVYNAGVWLAVYGFVWYYHWLVEREEGATMRAGQTLRRLQLYVVSSAALAFVAAGGFLNLSLIVSRIVSSPAAQLVGNDPAVILSTWILTFPSIIAGGLWWVFYFRYAAGQDRGSTLRQVYLYLWTLLGTAGTAIVFFAGLTELLRFLFGYRAVSVNVQLEILSFVLPMLIVAGAYWVYHWNVLTEESADARASFAGVTRRYTYLVSAVGLIALVVGLTYLVSVLLQMAVQVGQEIGQSPDWWRDQLSTFISLSVVGLVVWLPHWRRMAPLLEEFGAKERPALSRRMFLYGALLAAVITMLFNGAFFLTNTLRLLLGEPASSRLLANLFTNLSNVLILGLFLFYHWQVLQQDRVAVAAAPVRRQKPVAALASERFTKQVDQLEDVLGTKVTLLREVTQTNASAREQAEELSAAQVESLKSSILSTAGDKVLLLFTDSGVEVRSYS